MMRCRMHGRAIPCSSDFKMPGFGMGGGGWDGLVVKVQPCERSIASVVPDRVCIVAEVLRQNGYDIEFHARRPDCILPIGCTISTCPACSTSSVPVQSWIDYGGYDSSTRMGSGRRATLPRAIKTMLTLV